MTRVDRPLGLNLTGASFANRSTHHGRAGNSSNLMSGQARAKLIEAADRQLGSMSIGAHCRRTKHTITPVLEAGHDCFSVKKSAWR